MPPIMTAPPEDLADLAAALDEIEAGHTVTVTIDDLEHWAATGMWPATGGDST